MIKVETFVEMRRSLGNIRKICESFVMLVTFPVKAFYRDTS